MFKNAGQCVSFVEYLVGEEGTPQFVFLQNFFHRHFWIFYNIDFYP